MHVIPLQWEGRMAFHDVHRVGPMETQAVAGLECRQKRYPMPRNESCVTGFKLLHILATEFVAMVEIDQVKGA